MRFLLVACLGTHQITSNCCIISLPEQVSSSTIWVKSPLNFTSHLWEIAVVIRVRSCCTPCNRRPLTAHFYFRFRFWLQSGLRGLLLRLRTKFPQNRALCGEDIAIDAFSIWMPSTILHFARSGFWPSRDLWNPFSTYTKFGANKSTHGRDIHYENQIQMAAAGSSFLLPVPILITRPPAGSHNASAHQIS